MWKNILREIPLTELHREPVMFDANIFMVGIEKRFSDVNCSFENIKQLFILPIIESFQNILIHEEVYRELDEKSQSFIDGYLGKNVTIVGENNLYGNDPKYTTLFEKISSHELVRYSRGNSKDRGEVFSLSYAAYHGVNYFCSREIMVDVVAAELECLSDVKIITLDIVLLTACVYYAKKNDTSKSKALKSVYKKYCADVIKRHKLPQTLSEYVKEMKDYL